MKNIIEIYILVVKCFNSNASLITWIECTARNSSFEFQVQSVDELIKAEIEAKAMFLFIIDQLCNVNDCPRLIPLRTLCKMAENQ